MAVNSDRGLNNVHQDLRRAPSPLKPATTVPPAAAEVHVHLPSTNHIRSRNCQSMTDFNQSCSSPKAWQRFYMGYKERFVEDCRIQLLHNGKTIRCLQAPSANSTKSKRHQPLDKNADPALTGCTVWDGAVVLSQYLTSSGCLCRPADDSQLVSLELGAGTGAVSLSLLAAGMVHRAIITDIPDMVAHLQANVHHNSRVLNPAQALVRPLRWGQQADIKALAPFQPPFQLIVGSDLIYYSYSDGTPHSRLLLLALQQLAGPETQIYLALSLHHNPEEVDNFLRWAQESWGFNVYRIVSEVPEEYRVPDVLVVRMQLVDVQQAAEAAAAAQAGSLERGY